MRKIRALLVDDETNALDLLERLLLKTGKVDIIEKISDPFKVERSIVKHKPDALFLDIKMPNFDGVKILENIRVYQQDLPVIYVTASDNFGIEAVKLKAFDYILKPINRKELNNTIDSLINLIEKKEINKHKLPIQDGFVYLKNEEIFYLKAEGNYTHIFVTTGASYISSYNLGRLTGMLPDNNYLRINRSVFVNSDYLHKVNRKNKTCIIKSNDVEIELKVSTTFLQNASKIL